MEDPGSSVTVVVVKPYEEIWSSFKSERRLEFGGHKDPKWQGDHALSASFIVPVNVSRFEDRLAPLREDFGRLPFVSVHPDRFMHVTLLMLGFLMPQPEKGNEVSPARLAEISRRGRRALKDFPAFDIEFANVNAFPGAAFIEAHDGGKISELQDALCDSCEIEKPPGPPHLTLAYFQAPDDTPAPEEVISTLENYRDWYVGETRVEKVSLTILNINSEHPDPETLAAIDLGG